MTKAEARALAIVNPYCTTKVQERGKAIPNHKKMSLWRAEWEKQIIEANLVEDLLPDDECPSPPLTLNFTSSMGTHMTATTTTTASPLSVVEAQPMDESNTLRAFFRNRKVKFVICLLISFFLVLVLGTVYALTGFGLNKFD